MSPSFHIPPGLTDSVEAGNPPRLYLTGEEWFTHFLPVILLAALTLALLYIEYISSLEVIALPFFVTSVALLLTFFLLYRRNRALLFIPVASERALDESFHLVLQATGSARWQVIDRKEYSWLKIWTVPAEEGKTNYGERVTILFGEGVIYINSINDPGNRLHLFSGSANKDNASWIEQVLREGIWEYDPDRTLAEKDSPFYFTPRILPAATIFLDDVREGNPPRYIPRNSDLWINTISAPLAASIEASIHLTLDLYQANEIEGWTGAYIIAAFLLLPLLWFAIHFFYHSRFLGIRTEKSQAENYRNVLDALHKSGWQVNHEEPRRALEARIPYTRPENGEVALFIFRDNHVFVNLFRSADDPRLSYSLPTRARVFHWLRRTLTIEESVPFPSASPSFIKQLSARVDTAFSEDKELSCHIAGLLTANRKRLLFRGERWRRLFDLPLTLIDGSRLLLSRPISARESIQFVASPVRCVACSNLFDCIHYHSHAKITCQASCNQRRTRNALCISA